MRRPIPATFHHCSPLSSDNFPVTGLLLPGTLSPVHLQLIRCLHHPLCPPPSSHLYNRNILFSTSTEQEYMISRFQSGTTTPRTGILSVLLKNVLIVKDGVNKLYEVLVRPCLMAALPNSTRTLPFICTVKVTHYLTS